MEARCVSRACACACACACLPVVCIGEVGYDCGADAGYAPLTVVPSSCDDRQLRSTQARLTGCVMEGQKQSLMQLSTTWTEPKLQLGYQTNWIKTDNHKWSWIYVVGP